MMFVLVEYLIMRLKQFREPLIQYFKYAVYINFNAKIYIFPH